MTEERSAGLMVPDVVNGEFGFRFVVMTAIERMRFAAMEVQGRA